MEQLATAELPLSFWQWIIGIGLGIIGWLLAMSHYAIGHHLDASDKDRIAI